MKRKFLYVTAAVAALLSLGACGKQQPIPAAAEDGADQVYTGVLPAADAYGVRYTLLLDYDDDNGGGDYEMVQTYFDADSTGIADVASFASDGDFTVTQGENGQKYLKLTDKKNGEMYFVVNSDSTIVMTDGTMTPVATPGLNYTLKAAK